jgi:hypothetical protein
MGRGGERWTLGATRGDTRDAIEVVGCRAGGAWNRTSGSAPVVRPQRSRARRSRRCWPANPDSAPVRAEKSAVPSGCFAERGAVSGFGRVGGIAAAARGSRENSPLVAFVSTERDHPGRSARAGLWLSSARQSLHQENDPSPVT